MTEAEIMEMIEAVTADFPRSNAKVLKAIAGLSEDLANEVSDYCDIRLEDFGTSEDDRELFQMARADAWTILCGSVELHFAEADTEVAPTVPDATESPVASTQAESVPTLAVDTRKLYETLKSGVTVLGAEVLFSYFRASWRTDEERDVAERVIVEVYADTRKHRADVRNFSAAEMIEARKLIIDTWKENDNA